MSVLELPTPLRLEVKTSRGQAIDVAPRDLAGIGPAGFLVALLNERALGGPRWATIAAAHLRPATLSERELARAESVGPFASALNIHWGDWILDRSAWTRILERGVEALANSVNFARQHHPPRRSRLTGNVRETALAFALRALREGLDQASSAEQGPKAEGRFHQSILCDVLGTLGYRNIVNNPIGVPDITAERPLVDESHEPGWEHRPSGGEGEGTHPTDPTKDLP